MLRLDKFRIQGFKDAQRCAEVVLSSAPVSVIYGPNGSGKTSLLKAISAFLCQDDTALAEIGVTSIECEFSDAGSQYAVVVRKTEQGYDWSGFMASGLMGSSSLSLGVERGISTQLFRIDPKEIFWYIQQPAILLDIIFPTEWPRQFAEELAQFINKRQQTKKDRWKVLDFEMPHVNLQNIRLENIEELLLNGYRLARLSANKKIQSALFNTIAGAITNNGSNSTAQDPMPADFYHILNGNKARLLEALADDSTNEFKNIVIKTLSSLNEENYVTEVLEKPLLSRLFFNMINELELEKLTLSSINLLIDSFNKFLFEEKKLIVTDSEIYISVVGGRHSIYDLSSGERHMLTFLSLVLFQGQKRNFLIIDEPEISLNITWQRELLTLFSKLLPDTQIIVASHSPVMAKRNQNFLTPLIIGRIK